MQAVPPVIHVVVLLSYRQTLSTPLATASSNHRCDVGDSSAVTMKLKLHPSF